MSLLSDDTWLRALNAGGAEEFDTGKPEMLRGVWDRPSVDSLGRLVAVKNRAPTIFCRESDVAAHELVKQSAITRVADGSSYVVREFEPDGTGFMLITLGK